MCIDQTGISFADLNAPGNLENIKTDIKVYGCKSNGLSPASVTLGNIVVSTAN
ncbi:MAG: hypothetical protein KA270_09625 [Saprospiraceae bacterium]|nr:hypothetical protein [Saprospiraceae bacterium]